MKRWIIALLLFASTSLAQDYGSGAPHVGGIFGAATVVAAGTGITQLLWSGTTGALVTNHRSITLSGQGFRNSDAIGNEEREMVVFPTNGTLQNLRVEMDGPVGSGAEKWTVTVRKGAAIGANVDPGSNTSLTCDVIGVLSSCTDLDSGHNVLVTAGDSFVFGLLPTGGPNAVVPLGISVEFVSEVGNESVLLSSNDYFNNHNCTPHVKSVNCSSPATRNGLPVPIAGNMTGMYVRTDKACVGTGTLDVSLAINGSGDSANDVKCTIDPATNADNCNVTGVSVPVGTTDYITVYFSKGGTADVNICDYIGVGLLFEADAPGQFIMANATTDSNMATSTVTYYNSPMGGDVDAFNTVPAPVEHVMTTTINLHAMHYRGATAVTQGSWHVTLKDDANRDGTFDDTLLDCTVSSGNDCVGTATDTITANSALAWEYEPTGAPQIPTTGTLVSFGASLP